MIRAFASQVMVPICGKNCTGATSTVVVANGSICALEHDHHPLYGVNCVKLVNSI